MGDFVVRCMKEHASSSSRDTVTAIDGKRATLKSAARSRPDIVVSASACGPALDGRPGPGLAIDRGVTVNAYLETSVPAYYAAAISRAGRSAFP